MMSTEWTMARLIQDGIELIADWCPYHGDKALCEWAVISDPNCKCKCNNDHIHCQHGYIIEVG